MSLLFSRPLSSTYSSAFDSSTSSSFAVTQSDRVNQLNPIMGNSGIGSGSNGTHINPSGNAAVIDASVSMGTNGTQLGMPSVSSSKDQVNLGVIQNGNSGGNNNASITPNVSLNPFISSSTSKLPVAISNNPFLSRPGSLIVGVTPAPVNPFLSPSKVSGSTTVLASNQTQNEVVAKVTATEPTFSEAEVLLTKLQMGYIKLDDYELKKIDGKWVLCMIFFCILINAVDGPEMDKINQMKHDKIQVDIKMKDVLQKHDELVYRNKVVMALCSQVVYEREVMSQHIQQLEAQLAQRQ